MVAARAVDRHDLPGVLRSFTRDAVQLDLRRRAARASERPARRRAAARAARVGTGRREQAGQQEREQQASHVRSSGPRSVRTPRYDGWRRRRCGVSPSASTSTTSDRLHPVRAEGVQLRHLVDERAAVARVRRERRVQHRADLAGDAAADPSAVHQAVRGRLADEQRAQPGLGAGLGAPAAHDVRVAPAVRELEPVPAAGAELVARVEPLADDPLQPLLPASRRTASARRRTPAGSASGRRSGRDRAGSRAARPAAAGSGRGRRAAARRRRAA